MALPTPILDDRSYEQLLDELLNRIPVYAPEWTDRGASDPGITLLELFAHLGETVLYRFNQIPDQTRLWLLRLLQVPPQPPRRASGLVTFTALSPLASPPAVTLGSSVGAGDVPFRVGNDVTVLPVTVSAVIKQIGVEPTDPILAEEYQRVLDVAELDDQHDPVPYEERVLDPDPNQPGFEPIDVATAVDHCLWIAVHARADGPPGLLDQLRSVDSPLARQPLVLGFAAADEYPTIDEIDPCDGLATALMSSLAEGTAASADACEPWVTVAGPEAPGPPPDQVDSSLVWQATAATTDDPTSPRFLPVSVARDTTDGLRRDGVVALQLPATQLEELGAPVLEHPDLAGVGAQPPALAGRPPVLFWLRAFPRQGTPELGRVRWVGANVADVEQVAEAAPEVLGAGSGLSHQELLLAHRPIVAGTLTVVVDESTGPVTWTVVDSFAASQAGDRHLILDAAGGIVRCGDSVRGQVLPIGATVRTPGYRHGGGVAGTVKAGAISRVLDGPDVRVVNPLPTKGGEEGETISRALERIPGELTRHDRAVTADDFRELATIVGVGRAECLPRFDPPSKITDAAGVVTVVVWPTNDPIHPDAPQPDAALLRAVCRQLDERRLVTTELYVIPPTYRPVGVSVGLAVKKGYSAIGVRRWVELVLRQYLAPLPPYGPDGKGWPLGHRVHGPELEAAALQVEGVEFIEDLKVADLGGSAPVDGTVSLEPWEVPELTELTVVVGAAPDPGRGGPVPPVSASPVPIPVPEDSC